MLHPAIYTHDVLQEIKDLLHLNSNAVNGSTSIVITLNPGDFVRVEFHTIARKPVEKREEPF